LTTVLIHFPELPDEPTLPEDCGKSVGGSCLSEPDVTGGLERFTAGNFVPTLTAMSVRRLVVTGVATLRPTFCTSNLLQ
jgi:hypothetical protein